MFKYAIGYVVARYVFKWDDPEVVDPDED